MSKVAIIGIDGLDSKLLSTFIDTLPNFSKLKQGSPNIQLNSVFPPDSPTAWTTIYTGKNPAEHGIITFRDPFTPSSACEYLGNNISGDTFWDIAGNNGKKVCIIFPHLGYPVWPVNGVMVGRTTEVDIRDFNIQTYPNNMSERFDSMSLKPMTSYPIDPGDIIDPTKKLILNEMEFGLRLLKNVEWDLYYIYFSSLDNIEHLFWMYFDKEDPEYKENNLYNEVIPEMYEYYDKYVIGPIVQALDSNTTLIVISDHGHSMRPSKVVNINEILRRNGFLHSYVNGDGLNLNRHHLLEILRKQIGKTVSESRIMGKLASKFLSFYPKGMRIYTNSVPVDKDGTIACLSDPSGGLKAYSYAGIRINRDKISSVEEYEIIRDRIINSLLDIKVPDTSKNLVKWAIRREELYKGKYLSKYPDLLFRLRDDWGVNWEMDKSIYGHSFSHKLHSGNHRQETAVFLASGLSEARFDNMNLVDIAPTILDLLGIRREFAFDGTSIIQHKDIGEPLHQAG